MQSTPVAGGRLALIPLLPTGEFWREDLGNFKVTRADLIQVMRNAQGRSDLLQVDYNHNAFKGAAELNGDGVKEKRAAGWIDRRSLFIATWNGGYCLMGWGYLTAEAATRREAGELLYISPALERGKREIGRPGAPAGQEIGLTVLNVALCDIPFFDMPPVSLFSRRAQPGAFNRWARAQQQAFFFGGNIMDEQLKQLLSTILGQAGIAADLIGPVVDAIMQAIAQAQAAAAGTPAADPAGAAAAMSANPQQAAALALASMLSRYNPQQAAAPLFGAPQQQAAAPSFFNGLNPALFMPAMPQQQAAPSPAFFGAQPAMYPAAPQQPNAIGFLFNLLAQRAQAQQAQQAQQSEALALFNFAEAQGRNAYLQSANVNPQALAQLAPQLYQQAVNAGPIFTGAPAFSPAPQAFSQPQLNPAMSNVVAFTADKPLMLRRKVDEYQTAQAKSGRTITYTAAMSEARKLGLLTGLE